MTRVVDLRRERFGGRVARALGSALGVLAFSVVLSAVHPLGDPWSDRGSDQKSGKAEILQGAQAPEQVRSLLESKCGDCHSHNTRLPWYGHAAPVSWMVEHDVLEGREHMNLSRWQSYEADRQLDLLARVAAEVRGGHMPPQSYLWMHPQARLTQDEQQILIVWTRSERQRIRQLVR